MGILAFKGQQVERKKIGPFKNQDIQKIKNEFCFENHHVTELYECFSTFLPDFKGYLELDDLVNYFDEGDCDFPQLPYLQRLFKIISYKRNEKVFFEEYLVGISTFCLMNGEAILKFVFEWIDTDCDDKISKDDIIRGAKYQNPKTGQYTFFVNFIPQIEQYHKKKNDLLIDFAQFRQFIAKIPFLIWPAYQLQLKLRTMNLGVQFWKQQYLKIEKAELAAKNNEKKIMKLQQKIKSLKKIKTNLPQHRMLFKSTFKLRKPGEVSTDLNLQKHFEYKNQKIQRKKSLEYIKPQFYDRKIYNSFK